jgi:hypothetical protein
MNTRSGLVSVNTILLPCAVLAAVLAGCGESTPSSSPQKSATERPASGVHTHADGSTHGDHTPDMNDHDHDHDEVELGTIRIGEMDVRLAQSHGGVAPGKEGHLVVKLPYNDNGATVVRAWLGTEDRTLSYVGRGEYAASHDDYDIHAMAPDPLPENTMWWIEIERPDGQRFVGSIRPVIEGH